MNKKISPLTDFAELRRQAEARYDQRHHQQDSPMTEGEIQRLVHELQVHQIELEMQNEELQQSRTEVETWLKRYTDLYDFAPVSYFTLRQDGTISQVNLTGARLLGVNRSELVGKHFATFVADGDLFAFNNFLAQVFECPVNQTCEIILKKKSGELYWIQIEAVQDNGQECRAVVMDIQARKMAEIKLQHLSMHDGLTGLYNRSYFIESLERLAHGRHFPVSIMMADVDHLKETNDQLGHASGDDLLKRVAQVLTLTYRSEDVIARIGGDEFAVLLPNTSIVAAENALLRLYDVLQEHNTNYFAEPPLQLSMGIATAESGNSLIETLKQADANMYHHKRKDFST